MSASSTLCLQPGEQKPLVGPSTPCSPARCGTGLDPDGRSAPAPAPLRSRSALSWRAPACAPQPALSRRCGPAEKVLGAGGQRAPRPAARSALEAVAGAVGQVLGQHIGDHFVVQVFQSGHVRPVQRRHVRSHNHPQVQRVNPAVPWAPRRGPGCSSIRVTRLHVEGHRRGDPGGLRCSGTRLALSREQDLGAGRMRSTRGLGGRPEFSVVAGASSGGGLVQVAVDG